jgi:hypothetical protein
MKPVLNRHYPVVILALFLPVLAGQSGKPAARRSP